MLGLRYDSRTRHPAHCPQETRSRGAYFHSPFHSVPTGPPSPGLPKGSQLGFPIGELADLYRHHHLERRHS